MGPRYGLGLGLGLAYFDMYALVFYLLYYRIQ